MASINSSKLLLYYYLRVTTPPVIPGSTPMLRYVDIFGIVQFPIGRTLNRMNNLRCNIINKPSHAPRNYPRLKIKQDGSWYIVLIVCLIKEDVFTIQTLDHRVLQNTIWKKSDVFGGCGQYLD